MRPQNEIDFTTLTWVKGELDETLKQARQALEAYVEEPADASQMRFCATYLHQVQGTLRMVELYGAAMVTEEMERLAGALLDGAVENRDEAYGVLMRGIVQLPDYLERLQAGHKDIPIVLLPLLNELREVRGEKGLTEASLFTPNLAKGADGAIDGPAQPLPEAELKQKAGLLRGKFQIALLKWFKDENVDANLNILTEVGDELAKITYQQDARTLFWVTAGVLEALRGKAFEPSKELKQTIGKVEREIKRLADGGDAAFKTDPPRELTRNLLYFVAHAPTEHGRIAQMRELFDLQSLLPSQEELEHARGSLTGNTRSLIGTVSSAIKEDLMRVKDALDLFLRNANGDPSTLAPQAEILDRVSGTLGMLGLGVAQRVVKEQHDAIRNVVSGSRAADESTLLDIAGALIYIENTLDDQVQHLGGAPGRGEDAASPLPAIEQQRVLEAVVKEAQNSFGGAKQCFVAFIESGWDHSQLDAVPGGLMQVAGALRIIERGEAADYLDAIAAFTRRELLEARRVPNVVQMETLADALASIEYFLEALYERRPSGERVLSTARTSLEKLGYWPVPPEPVATTPKAEVPVVEAKSVAEPAEAAAPQVAEEAPALYESAVEPIADTMSDFVAEATLVSETLAPETQAAVGPVAEVPVPEVQSEPTPVVETPAPEAQAAPEPVVEAPVAPAATPVPTPVPAAPIVGGFEASSDEIDEEIREVFVEEVAEEIANLDELLPAWKSAPQNLDQLKSIRRVFHTLKGSGRLVGALTLGEFSWKLENMMNRVLDHTIQPTPAVVELVEHAHAALPELLAALKGEGSVTADLEEIKRVADRLCTGEQAYYVPRAVVAEPVVEETVQEPEAAETAGTPEAVAGTAPEMAVAEAAAQPEVSEEPQIEAEAAQQVEPEPEPQGLPIPAIDPLLLDILKGEISGHLETVDAYLAKGPVAIDETLLRAVHTMNGAFAMTDVPVVTDVLAPLEGYFKRLRHSAIAPTADGFAAIGEVAATVRGVLTELDKPAPRLIEVPDLVERIVALRDSLPDTSAPTVPVSLPDELAQDEIVSSVPASFAPETSVPDTFIAPPAEAPLAFAIDVPSDELPVEPGMTVLETELSNLADSFAGQEMTLDAIPGEVPEALDAVDGAMAGVEEIALPESPSDEQDAGGIIFAETTGTGFDDFIATADSVPLEEAISDIRTDLSSAVDLGSELGEVDLSAFGLESAVEPEYVDASQAESTPLPEPEPLSPEAADAADPNLGDIDIEAFAADLEAAPSAGPEIVEGLEIREREDEEAVAAVEATAFTAEAEELEIAEVAEAAEAAEATIDVADEEMQRLISEFESAPEETAATSDEFAPSESLPTAAFDATPAADVPGYVASEADPFDIAAKIRAAFKGSEAVPEEMASEGAASIPAMPEAVEESFEVESFQSEETTVPSDEASVEDIEAMEEPAVLDDGFEGSPAAEEILAEDTFAPEAEAPVVEEPVVEAHAVEFAAETEAAVEPVIPADVEPVVDHNAAASRLLAEAFVAGLDSADPDPNEPLSLPDMDEELLDIFLEEATDILDNSDNLMVKLRENPADIETITALQRDMHTIKGGARMAGLYQIGDLGHAMEDLMEKAAKGEMQLPVHALELLDAAYDRLNRMVKRVGARQALAHPELLKERIRMLAEGRTPAIASQPNALVAEASEPSPVAAAIAAAAEVAAPLETSRAAVPEAPKPAAAPEDEIEVRAPQEQIRIRADLLDRLVNYAGEVAIYRARLEQQLGLFRGNLGELEQTTDRLREQLRKLEIETEAQIASRYQREAEIGGAEVFDPLELDRFSTLQQLTRALSESAADLASLKGTLEEHTRQYETLLLQQSRVSSDLQEGLMRTRMVPFDSIVPRLRRIIRQTASELSKRATLKVEGAQGEMDRNVLDRMTAPLEHMLRNSIAHGFETPAERVAVGKPEEGTVRIQLLREGSEVVIKVSDDGRGLDKARIRQKAIDHKWLRPDEQISDRELYAFILRPGLTTADTVSKIAGRGVGMDVVHNEIRQLGGVLQIDSEAGKGTTFTVRLPFTLAVTQAVFVQQGDTMFAVPIASVQGVSRIDRADLDTELASGNPKFRYAGEDYEIHDLGRLLGSSPTKAEGALQVPLLLARSGDHRAAITVDHVIGSREIVVKPVGAQVSSIPGIFGATIMGDGRVIVILDVAPLVRRFVEQRAEGYGIEETPAAETHKIPLVMVVDDSITMRKVTSRVLERNGYEVMTAKDGVDAIEKLVDRIPDCMLLDIEMPRMDGYELATHIRNDVRLRGIPIIMITSRTGDKHRQRAFEIGVDRYLGKPYQEADLMRNVEEILKVGRG